jgi:hypothetical protein
MASRSASRPVWPLAGGRGDEAAGQRAAQRHDQQGAGGEDQQGAEPAHAADQARCHRNHQELAEGAGRGDHAHGPAARASGTSAPSAANTTL